MYAKEVRNAELKDMIQLTFMEAMSIFIFTIFIGILNAVDLVTFTHAELLFHLHSGTIGWLSLSAVTLIVWFFTGERDLDEETVIMAKNVLRNARIVIPIYVVFFYLGFTLSEGDEILRIVALGDGSDLYFILMVLGALAATGVFAYTLYFGYLQLEKTEVITTPHYLFLGAMLTSTYGGIFGLILEIQHLFGTSFYDADAGQDGIASHAAAMEAGYLFMFIAAVLEWQIIGENAEKITRGGYITTGSLFFAGFTVAIGAGFNFEPLLMLNLPLLLIGYISIVVRILVKIDPKSIIGTEPSRFYIPAAIGLTYSVGFFLYIVNLVLSGEEDPTTFFEKPWIVGLALANIHLLFVGGATGVIISTIMVLLKDADNVNKQLENIGFVLMYIGLLGFAITLIYRGHVLADDSDTKVRTDIAAVMGTGLYILLFTLFTRFRTIRKSS